MINQELDLLNGKIFNPEDLAPIKGLSTELTKLLVANPGIYDTESHYSRNQIETIPTDSEHMRGINNNSDINFDELSSHEKEIKELKFPIALLYEYFFYKEKIKIEESIKKLVENLYPESDLIKKTHLKNQYKKFIEIYYSIVYLEEKGVIELFQEYLDQQNIEIIKKIELKTNKTNLQNALYFLGIENAYSGAHEIFYLSSIKNISSYCEKIINTVNKYKNRFKAKRKEIINLIDTLK